MSMITAIEAWISYSAALRPMEKMSPSKFAATYRHLAEKEAEQPGRWSNEVFPYLAPIMDAVELAMSTGKRGFVMMKSAQGGGSQAMINVWAWLQTYFPGPIAYSISKDDVAEEFGRVRFTHAIDTMEPLRRKALRGRAAGESLTKKRFVDGMLSVFGGKSVLNLQSTPYRFFFLDEVDSLISDIKNEGDPIKLAEQRLASYFGQTLLLAFAHPSMRGRGAAKLYYELSDQRRGFVVCPFCSAEFYLQWEHVIAVPTEGLNKQQAERDARCYQYQCPKCKKEVSDAHRIRMVKSVEYKSTLSSDEAAKKPWVGVHFSQLYMSNQPIRKIAEQWIACIDNPSAKRVFYNKVLGEHYEESVEEVTAEQWQKLITVPRTNGNFYRGIDIGRDPEAYRKGEVPPGVVFLTAGQDSRSTELHYCVWGWGLRRTVDKFVLLCGWLIDWGVVERAYSLTFSEGEFHIFDDLIYRKLYTSTYGSETFEVMLGGHDVGYAPTQIPIHQYCRHWPGRAVPTKGAALDATSACKAPHVRWGNALRYKLGDEEIVDEHNRPLILNTFMLKTDITAWLSQTVTIDGGESHGRRLPSREMNRIALPIAGEVDDVFLAQASNEYLSYGKKKDERVWKKKGPNHYADCNTYAYACALQLDPFQGGLSFEETEQVAEAEKAKPPNFYVPGMEE
jgi:phage terminase large subunit GpA-like protein